MRILPLQIDGMMNFPSGLIRKHAPLHSRDVEPPDGVVGILGGFDGGIDVLVISLADRGDDLAGGGVHDTGGLVSKVYTQWNAGNPLDGFAAVAIDELAVDVETSAELGLDVVTLGGEIVLEDRRHCNGMVDDERERNLAELI